MRIVTGLTTIDAHRRVLKDEGTSLVDVALHAGLLVALSLIDHPGARRHVGRGRKRPVRIVAIGALDHALIHPMLKGHRELRLDLRVTGITQVHLLGHRQ